jgi:hypothetical protein
MSRFRALVVLTVLATAGLLVPAGAASAATPLTATIVCDAADGIITTHAAGTVLAPGKPRPVVVQFARLSARNFNATGGTVVAPVTPVKVTTLSTVNGTVDANGYTSVRDPGSFYYTESVRVTFMDLGGFVYSTRDATCARDAWTTLSLTCDTATGTVTAATTGHDANVANVYGRPYNVAYQTFTTHQDGPDDPRWTSGSLGVVWDVSHRLTAAADGTWADTGYVHTPSASTYYYAEQVNYGVFDSAGNTVGGGTASCTLYNGGATTPVA